MEITADTTLDDVRNAWGSSVTRDDLRTANSRRGRLQRLSRLRSRNYDVTLALDPDHRTAHVNQEPDSGPEIVVTARELDQPVTDYPAEAWDWLAQKAFAIHEVGHIKYTDHDDFMARLDDVDASLKGTAKNIWNALEDGAIEVQIRKRWPNYSVPLLHLRANVFADNEPGIEDPEQGGNVVPVAHAVQTGALDLATYNSGAYQRLLDDDDGEFHFSSKRDRELYKRNIAPKLADVVPKVLSEPVGARRNKMIFEFIDDIAEYIDDADADGKAQQNRDEQQSGGMPDDATESHSGGAESDADALDDETAQQAEERVSEIVGDDGTGDDEDADGDDDAPVKPVDPDGTLDTDDDEEDADGAAGDAGDDADDEGQGATDETGDPLETDDELADELQESVSDQRSEESGATADMMDEMDSLMDAAGGDELEDDKIVVPDARGDGDRDRFNRYKAQSARFEQLLRQKLKQERKSKTKRGVRRGRLDGPSLHRTQTGSKGVKKREQSPDEKDYAITIVVDRSGSMSGTKVAEAEETLTKIGTALEAVGVDVMVINLLDSKAQVGKPFGVDFENRIDHVVNNDTGGGTPLAQCIRLARERLNQYPTSAQRAMMVITDGSPSSPDDYSDALERCAMPVIGVQLTSGSGAGEEFYHRYVTAAPGTGELQAMTQELVQEAMDI